jgi:hypothetical protein
VKITLARHGGIAAGIRRPNQVLDAAALPDEGRAELARLVAAARSASRAESPGPGRARDAMGYSITVDEGGQPVVMSASEGNMTPAFTALLEWVERHVK